MHAYFVDLIDYDDWVLALKSLELLDEDAWLTVNISTLTAFDMNWIVLSTHRNDGCRSFQAFTD